MSRWQDRAAHSYRGQAHRCLLGALVLGSLQHAGLEHSPSYRVEELDLNPSLSVSKAPRLRSANLRAALAQEEGTQGGPSLLLP